MNKYHIIFPVLILALLTSCSTKKKNVPIGPKSYSQDVESEFNSIENSQKDILNYYRHLREQNWDDYKLEGKRDYNYPKKKSFQSVRPKPKLAPTPRATPQVIPLPESQIEEMKIEMRQHMSFFCMENRKSSRFSDKADCTAFTEDALNTCQEKFSIISDRGIVNCLKARLR